MGDAIKAGHLDLAKWLFDRDGRTSVSIIEHWSVIAAGNGDLQMVQWVCSLAEDANVWKALDEAVIKCHLNVVQWIMKHPRKVDNSLHTAMETCARDVDKLLVVRLDGPATSGRLDVVEWLLQHYADHCCVNGGDLDAVRQGHFGIVRLLRMNNVKGCSNRVLRAAAEGGHLDIVKWLYENGTEIQPGFANNATNTAATNGFLDVVKWLQENTSERTTTLAIDGAAANGHLDVIQWLHESHDAGCTSFSMDQAAADGHLDAVKWLHVHCTEGCSATAMNLASINGHIDTVKWLHNNRHEVCTTTAMLQMDT